jgi:amino acid transporter
MGNVMASAPEETSSSSATSHDDQAILEAGYRPQLRRSLGFFSSFAITFSAVSVLMGIFGNFGFVLNKAGPFGFWTWPLVACGQLLVALVFAEMAGRIPLTGAIYNWNTRLANPTVGWLSAWMLFAAYSVGNVGVIVALMPPLQTFVGHEFSGNMVRCVGVGIILSHALINIYGVHIAAYMNKIAVVAEIIALVVFGFILLAVVLAHNEAHVALLTTIPENPSPYWPGFLLATLLAAWTIICFELSSDLSEETLNVRRITPKSILSGVSTSAILGFLFLVILTLAIPDLTAVTAASDPISTIVAAHLGAALTKIFLVSVLVAMYAVSLLLMAAAARVLFAVARDRRVPGSSFLTKISSHKVPIVTTLIVMVIEIISVIAVKDAVDLFAATTVLIFLVYLITVVSFAFGIKKLPTPTSFSLGRWRGPVVALAVVWLACEIGILTLPEEFHNAAIIAGSAVAAGLLLYFVMGRRHV